MTDKENFEKDINVPSKEQIICKYKFEDKEKFNGKPYCTCFNELCEDLSFACDNNCQIYEDFKQLVRKTQECRELEIKNVTLQNRYQQVAGATTEAACYRKALEEIEEMAKTCLYQDVCVLCPHSDKCENPYDVLVYESSRGILNIINKVKGDE